MKIRRLVCLGALGWAQSLAGCSGDTTHGGSPAYGTGGGSPGPAPTGTVQPGTGAVPLDNLAHELTIAMCNLLARCFSLTPAATCVATEENRFSDQTASRISRAIAAGRVVYDPAAMRTCLDKYAELSCDYANESDLAPLCANALRGTVPTGGECENDLECSDALSAAHCASSGTCPGHCEARGGLGAPCSNDADCQLTLACDTVAATCATRLKTGDSCSQSGGSGHCGGITACQEDATTGQYTCTTLGAGRLAAESQECAWNECESGLVCMATGPGDAGQADYRCQKPANSGGPCRFAIPSACPEGEYCPISVLDAATTTATCTPRAGANQPCDTGIGDQCQTGTICRSDGVCVPIQRIGGACSTAQACYSDRCTNGACVAPQDCAG